MKNIIRFAVLLLFIPVLSNAQPPWGASDGKQQLTVDDLKGPKITWEKESFVLGEIPQNIPVTVKYVFTNTGNAPLIISKVEPACDCTAAEWQKTPIMPGQKSEIIIEFNAESKGKFSKSAVVTSNAKPSESTILFTGTVVEN